MVNFRPALPRMHVVVSTLFLLVVRPTGLSADKEHEVGQEDVNDALQNLMQLAATLGVGNEGRHLNAIGGFPAGNVFGGLGGLGKGPGDLLGQMGGLFRQDQAAGGVQSGVWGLLGNIDLFSAFNNVTSLRQAQQQPFGFQQIYNDFTQALPSVDQVLDFVSDPVNSLRPEPLSQDVKDMMAQDTAEAVFVLSLLSAIFNLVSSILYTVSGGLSTLAASLSLIPASLALVTAPLGFDISAAAFAVLLWGNADANMEKYGDRLYTAWSQSLLRLSERLAQLSASGGRDGIRDKLASYRTQLTEAGGMLTFIQDMQVKDVVAALQQRKRNRLLFNGTNLFMRPGMGVGVNVDV